MTDQDSAADLSPVRPSDVRDVLKSHLDTVRPDDPYGFYVADRTRSGKPELNLWLPTEHKRRPAVCLDVERGEARFWFAVGDHPDVDHVAIRYGQGRRGKSYLKFERNMPWLPMNLVFEKRGWVSRQELDALVEIAEHVSWRRPVPSPVAPGIQCPDCGSSSE